uniref:Secreted peptide n=1 Tax=Syphacia muris TaxID=451379 RepID=A0A0N5AM28_9BILA
MMYRPVVAVIVATAAAVSLKKDSLVGCFAALLLLPTAAAAAAGCDWLTVYMRFCMHMQIHTTAAYIFIFVVEVFTVDL